MEDDLTPAMDLRAIGLGKDGALNDFCSSKGAPTRSRGLSCKNVTWLCDQSAYGLDFQAVPNLVFPQILGRGRTLKGHGSTSPKH